MDTGNLKFNGQDITYTGQVLTYMGGDESNTHGLPPDTVALMTQNFGSVDNFLRLRNQGQV